MGKVFQLNEHNYAFRSGVSFTGSNINTVRYGQQSISCLVPRIWKQVPDNIKESPSIKSFKLKIKMWVPQSYTPVDYVRGMHPILNLYNKTSSVICHTSCLLVMLAYVIVLLEV